MRAGAGLDTDHALRVYQAASLQTLGVLAGDEIVGHHGNIDTARRKARQQSFDQGRLAGTDRPANSDPGRPQTTLFHDVHLSM